MRGLLLPVQGRGGRQLQIQLAQPLLQSNLHGNSLRPEPDTLPCKMAHLILMSYGQKGINPGCAHHPQAPAHAVPVNVVQLAQIQQTEMDDFNHKHLGNRAPCLGACAGWHAAASRHENSQFGCQVGCEVLAVLHLCVCRCLSDAESVAEVQLVEIS